jgi:hypothetical protein
MTQEIKNYIQGEMFCRLFDDVIELVQETSDYIEGAGVIDTSYLPQKEQNLYANKVTDITSVLIKISEFVLTLKAYSKNETETLKKGIFKPYNLEEVECLPFKFNGLLTQSKQLYDRVIRIDNQLKNDNQSYFNNLKITL